MKKIETYLIISVIFACSLLLSNRSLLAQTTKKTPPDTTKKSVEKLQPKDEKPKLELPDVLIYGTDRSVRKSGDKLDRSYDDAKLVAPISDYQPLTENLKFENQKGYFEYQKKGIDSRTVVQLNAGRFQQFNIEAGQWRETENYNYSVFGKYDRSDGQYDNSQHYQGLINGQFGIRLSPNFVISSQGDYRLSDYGLYGAPVADLHRNKSGGKAKIDALWSLTAEQSADLSVYFQQNNCKDDDGNDYNSKLEQRTIGLVSLYQTKYRSIPIFIRGLYEYQKLNQVTNETINTQNYLQLKSWSSFKIKKYFIIKPGIQFENLDVNDSLSKYLVSPEIEIIAMPVPKVGLLLKGTRGFSPINYADLCEKSPFLSYKMNFVPMKKDLELKLGIEYNPTSRVSLSGEIIRQNWKNYAYWSRDTGIGLFKLNSINKATLTALNFQSSFTLSSKINFDAGIQIHFDEIKDDSVANNNNRVPYLERFRIPFNFEYKFDKATQALLTFQWISPRYANLDKDVKLASFGLLSVYLEKQLIKNISVFIEGNNLLNQKYEYWQGFPGMGFYFEVGFKGNW